MILNREQLSGMLGVSLRTVDVYRQRGMPGEAPKRNGDKWKFDSVAVIGWLRDRERAEAAGSVDKQTLEDSGRRKLAAEASMAEHSLALRQGAAVAIADFEAAWAAMIGAARAKLLGLGMSLGQEVALVDDPYQCNLIIEAAVKEALRELSEFEPDLQIESEGDSGAAGEDAAGDEPVGSAAGTDGQSVGRRRTPA